MKEVAWHMKRGNWWVKAGVVGVLCALFFLSITAFGSVIPTMMLLLAIIVYTWMLKYYEHRASVEVEILKDRANQYQTDKAYTEEQVEQAIDGILYRKFEAGEAHGNVRDHELRCQHRKDAEALLDEKAADSKDAYFRQLAKLEEMGYTQEEIQAFHNLTYKHAETAYGSKLNIFMVRTQDSKSERIVKWIVGLVFMTFWTVELYTFISDNSPFIRLVKLLLITGFFGLVWGNVLSLTGYKPHEKTYSECGSCGNMHTGMFCGCYWAAYINWKK